MRLVGFVRSVRKRPIASCASPASDCRRRANSAEYSVVIGAARGIVEDSAGNPATTSEVAIAETIHLQN